MSEDNHQQIEEQPQPQQVSSKEFAAKYR